MEWYALRYDLNEHKVVPYNIFNSVRFSEGVQEILGKDITSFEDFVKELDKVAKYAFWCKAEYEIMIGDLFEEDVNKFEKVDVYTQLVPNMKTIAEMILSKNM